jgi:hypothetical protein
MAALFKGQTGKDRIWHRGVAETQVLGVYFEMTGTEQDFFLHL